MVSRLHVLSDDTGKFIDWGYIKLTALEVCSSLIFVKPEWIYACDKAGKFVPYQRYQIVA
ncbi:hypothetical protein ACTXT7_009113 [Hymenolepis weldensis]